MSQNGSTWETIAERDYYGCKTDGNVAMWDVTEFSRVNCLAICGFLVPANLLATLQTLIFIALARPQPQINKITGLAFLYASLMVFHVFTWFMVGVVMAPTFILLGLGCTCLVLNFWAIALPVSMRNFLLILVDLVVPRPSLQTSLKDNFRENFRENHGI
jgi:hypothetical protein